MIARLIRDAVHAQRAATSRAARSACAATRSTSSRPSTAELAIRIELFDDEIESLQLFDPLTGRIRQKIPRFTVYPSSHYVTPRDTVLRAIETIKVELRERLEVLRRATASWSRRSASSSARASTSRCCSEIGYCKGIENYSRHLSGAAPGEPPPTLIDYLPKDALMFLDESHVS